MPTERSVSLSGLALGLSALVLPACSDAADAPSAANGGQGGGAGTSSAGSPAGAGGATDTGGAGTMGGSAGALAGSSSGGAAPGPCLPADALVCSTMSAFPLSIKDTGLFPGLPDLTQRHPHTHLFEPNPPLWSNGLAKERLLVLPAGTKVDNSDALKWKFPMGALLVKSFFDDGGPNKTRRPVETRLIRHSQDPLDPFSQWEFAVYQWNTEGTDATLISFDDPMKTTPHQVVVDRMQGGQPLRLNEGRPFTHNIPSKQDCQACHDANAKLTESDIIGFDELRLNWKLPGAAKTQLETLVEEQVLSTLPAAPSAIVEADPVLSRVKAWVHGNCVHCHNGAEGMLDLRPDVFVANTVNRAPEGAGIMPPSTAWKRIVPKQPELSVLFVQARRAPLPTGPSVQLRAMPPVGVEVAEMTRPSALTDAPEYVGTLPPTALPSQVPADPIADLATWINSLP